jgi:succinate dehydrogenase/fumarate reductase cytochrome b subunit
MEIKKDFDLLTQFALPGFTIISYLLTAMKHPEFGLVMSLMAQPFWLYSTWKAYKKLGQIGMFVTSVVITIIVGVGVINYWFL